MSSLLSFRMWRFSIKSIRSKVGVELLILFRLGGGGALFQAKDTSLDLTED